MAYFLHSLEEELPSSGSLHVNQKQNVDPKTTAKRGRRRLRLSEIVFVAEALLP